MDLGLSTAMIAAWTLNSRCNFNHTDSHLAKICHHWSKRLSRMQMHGGWWGIVLTISLTSPPWRFYNCHPVQGLSTGPDCWTLILQPDHHNSAKMFVSTTPSNDGQPVSIVYQTQLNAPQILSAMQGAGAEHIFLVLDEESRVRIYSLGFGVVASNVYKKANSPKDLRPTAALSFTYSWQVILTSTWILFDAVAKNSLRPLIFKLLIWSLHTVHSKSSTLRNKRPFSSSTKRLLQRCTRFSG